MGRVGHRGLIQFRAVPPIAFVRYFLAHSHPPKRMRRTPRARSGRLARQSVRSNRRAWPGLHRRELSDRRNLRPHAQRRLRISGPAVWLGLRQPLSAALVDPDGQLVRADAHQNTDLYWACRGRGGGSFGIATSFTVRLKKVANVIVFRVVWLGLSTKAAKSVMKAWQSWALQAPRTFDSNLVVAKGANGTINMHAAGQLVGTLAELQRELKELPNSRSVLIRRPAGRLYGETIPVRLTQEMITAIDKWIAAKISRAQRQFEH
jgi:hypothetical protein